MHLRRQAEQGDEAVRPGLIVHFLRIEGGDLRIIQAVGAGHARADDVALVELELHGAGDGLLGLFAEGAHGLAQRGVPLAVVHQIGKLQRHALLVVLGVLVQAQLLQHLVGVVEDGSAGSLVHAAALHAHQAVLHDVDDAHAVLAAQLVELPDQIDGVHLLAVDGHRNALLKVDGDVLGLLGGLLGGHAHLHVAGVLRLVCGILQLQALVGQMPHVLVLGVVGLAADLQRDVVRLGVVDLLLAALDVPDSPGSDDGHVGGEGLHGQLEANLIVALAGAAVGDGVRALRLGDLHQALGDDRAGHGGAQQVGVLILRAHLHAGEDHVLDELLVQILDVELGGAGLEGLLLQTVQLAHLTHVAGDRDDLAALVVLLQPGDDDGGVQSAGICQHNFLVILLFHDP